MYVYFVCSLEEWRAVRALPRTAQVLAGTHVHEEWSDRSMFHPMLGEHIVKEVASRARLAAGNCSPVGVCYDKPPAWWWPRRRVVCKVRVDGEEALVRYDDHLYVHLLNSLGNGFHQFLSLTEAEDAAMQGASEDECRRSYARVFMSSSPGDVRDVERDPRWCGRPQPFAFVPCLRRDMIVKASFYDGARRVRRIPRFVYKKANKQRKLQGGCSDVNVVCAAGATKNM